MVYYRLPPMSIIKYDNLPNRVEIGNMSPEGDIADGRIRRGNLQDW